MYAHELFEQNKPRVVVTYPGRFQPFHQGHAGVFTQLQKKFGAENVFIATSNDQSSSKSPFNFGDKYQLMTAAGVPADKIIQTNTMYALPEGIDPLNTIFITAVGAPDADRLNPDSVLKRDKKDKSGNIVKPAGSPGYYKIWDPKHDPVTSDQHGYVIVIPEIKKSIQIGGQIYDVSHGTETRNLWNAVRDDEKSRLEFLSQLYGRPSSELANIFDKIQQTAKEDIAPGSSDSASPIHGGQVYEQGVPEGKTENCSRTKSVVCECKSINKLTESMQTLTAICVLEHSDRVKGIILLKQEPNSPTIIVGQITGLEPGQHGFHIHEFGDLSRGCESAGKHYNPDNVDHGDLDNGHVGDLGNITADQDGTAKFSIVAERVNLMGDTSVVGRAIVIHENQDDLGQGGDEESLVSGNAGRRLACGVITLKETVTEAARVARKPGQPAGSKKHSDLYTDENPKGTITGLKFATVEDARTSVSKIRNSGRSHAHKIQAAVAMEQRARAAGKASAAAVYRKYINANKKTSKTEGVAEDRENYNGVNILFQKDDDEIFVKASAGGRELGHVLFVIDGDYLMPQDLEVEERYQGQGIAATMYDYVKSKGYKIRRSGQQTDAGAGFWDKHKPGKNVWEQTVAEGWSQKYKRSINCSHPKGFSQKAHCAGKKKNNESIEMEMICEDCGMCETHGDHSQNNLMEACWKGYHKEGMKTMFGKRYPNCVKNKNESLETYIRKGECPGCGERMVAESQLNEKQDACYHKVKSRYKVWPSAYASGALVQCRKKGAANWGNKSESITQEEYDQLDENLKKWFSDKWVRFGPDGKIRGPCARGSSSEGKPKCLPQSKAHALGKKGRASAGARKRKQDPDANRSGRAINVATKQKSNEDASGVIATKKQARDPRYSMSLTKDVRPGQIEKNLRAFKLAEQANNNNDMFELFAKFLPLAMRDLGLTMLPKIVPELRIESTNGQASFGRFVDGEMTIQLTMANRHPVDILRTLAHELVHYKQKTLGKIKHDSGETGSPEENQANTIAGIIMRHFNKEYPDAVNMQPIELKESQVTVNYGIGKNPGRLVKVGADGRVPHAKLHVNVNKNTAKKLGIPHFNENFADGRNPGDKGSLKAKVKGKVTMAKARAILSNKNSTPRAKQLAHWFINMNKGRNK